MTSPMKVPITLVTASGTTGTELYGGWYYGDVQIPQNYGKMIGFYISNPNANVPAIVTQLGSTEVRINTTMSQKSVEVTFVFLSNF